MHAQDQLAGGNSSPAQLVESETDVTVPAEVPDVDCGPSLTASEPAKLPERGESNEDPFQVQDAEPGSGTQPPSEDPPANIPNWLFLPERRLEADPLRVRPADTRSAREMYKRTLLLEESGGVVAGAHESGMSADQMVSATAAQVHPPGDGREHGSNDVKPLKSNEGRGRLRGAIRAMSRTLRGQYGHNLSG